MEEIFEPEDLQYDGSRIGQLDRVATSPVKSRWRQNREYRRRRSRRSYWRLDDLHSKRQRWRLGTGQVEADRLNRLSGV